MLYIPSMVLEQEGSVSRACHHCQNHVQRLRGLDQASTSPGSRRRDPGVLRPRRPIGQSNSSGKQNSTGLRRPVETPCDLEPCQRKPDAKIAAFLLKKTTARCSPAPSGAVGVSGVKASSRTHFLFHTTACRLDARTETSPPHFFAQPP